MKKTFLLVAAMLLSMAAMAQNDVDAFRFSQTDWSGTARFMSAGGAFGAIGGDFSSLSTNPAGLGIYKKSELSFTPLVINAIGSKSQYNDENVDASSVRYSLTNLGLVLNMPMGKSKPEEERKWRSLNVGFGYNRIKDFNNIVYASGMSGGSSIADAFVGIANGTNFNNLAGDALVAWNTWLIDTIPGDSAAYRNFIGNHDMRQSSYTKTTGGIDEMTFSIGSNYNDKLFLGFTLGVPFLSCRIETEYQEIDENDEVGNFNGFTSTEVLRTSGTGINAKLGVICQPARFLRLALAIHTPTYYGNMREHYSREISPDFDTIRINSDSYENLSRYKLSTPFRVMGSVGFIISKRAFVSAEYEFSDYSTMRLISSEDLRYRYDFKDENKAIHSKYGASHTVRVGGELTVTDHFLVRLGYALNTSGYKKDAGNSSLSHNICGGIGFRSKSCFFDMAYVCHLAKESFWFYSDPQLNPVETGNVNHRFMATLGFKF